MSAERLPPRDGGGGGTGLNILTALPDDMAGENWVCLVGIFKSVAVMLVLFVWASLGAVAKVGMDGSKLQVGINHWWHQ